MQIIDDPALKALAKDVLARIASERAHIEPWFFVGTLPEIGTGHFVRSRAHGEGVFVLTYAERGMCEQVAEFMNEHLDIFPPTEDPEELGERFEHALKTGAFRFRFSA